MSADGGTPSVHNVYTSCLSLVAEKSIESDRNTIVNKGKLKENVFLFF